MSKRLNIMLYSKNTGEQIILPVNPEKIELKFEKEIETYDVLGYGKINIAGNRKPITIKFSHFLPEDDSVFNTNSGIMYQINGSEGFIEYNYSLEQAVEMFRRWAVEKVPIRVVVDDELNIECFVSYFAETERENTLSRPYVLEVVENRSPFIKKENSFGIYQRGATIDIPKTIVMKKGDTVYSIANKYGLNYQKLAENNDIKDVNQEMIGAKLSTIGA